MDWLYRLLGAMLSFFESTLGSYAMALLMYALIFKIVFLPFSIKQQKNQIKMAKLAPKISLIKAKYKGRTDQVTMQKQQQEIMELQQKEGYSAFSGCLPLLIQMPIIILLYAVIQNPLSYIANTTDELNAYNDSRNTENVEYSEKFKQHYGTHIYTKDNGEKVYKEIKLDDVILEIYKENEYRIKADTKSNTVTIKLKDDEVRTTHKLTIKTSDEYTITAITKTSADRVQSSDASATFSWDETSVDAYSGKTFDIKLDGKKKKDVTIEVNGNPGDTFVIEYTTLQILSEMPKNTEINAINYINKFIDDVTNTYSGSETLGTREQRIAYIESYGLDYESIPNFMFLGANLAEKPSIKFSELSAITAIPFLAAAAQWVSMWLTRKLNGNGMQQEAQDKQTAASMKMMDIIFPAMTVFMAFGFSAMLGLYWIFQSLLGLLVSFIIAKAMPLPKYTEEEIKSFRKAEKEAEKAQREAAKSQPKYRSLHYIDDDDYEILPDAPVTNNEHTSASNKLDGDIPEIKD